MRSLISACLVAAIAISASGCSTGSTKNLRNRAQRLEKDARREVHNIGSTASLPRVQKRIAAVKKELANSRVPKPARHRLETAETKLQTVETQLENKK